MTAGGRWWPVALAPAQAQVVVRPQLLCRAQQARAAALVEAV
jgi:hypothetical protein